jgi:hypothetical protein
MRNIDGFQLNSGSNLDILLCLDIQTETSLFIHRNCPDFPSYSEIHINHFINWMSCTAHFSKENKGAAILSSKEKYFLQKELVLGMSAILLTSVSYTWP